MESRQPPTPSTPPAPAPPSTPLAPPAPPTPPAPSTPRPAAPGRWARRAAVAAEAVVIAAALGALGLWCSVPDTARLAADNPASTAFIDLRRSQAAAAGKPFNLRWQWRSLGQISRYLRAAAIYAEDDHFYHHDGVDWHAIGHAVSADWTHGAMSVGGSTITQQLAKNLYLSPRRSMLRKAREALIAFSLEDHLSKQRILELYLNVVEWGDGVFGAEAAAHTWFHHGAQSLSPSEAVRLAIALPNPITRAPSVHSAELTRKAVRLIRFLRWQGLIDAVQERTALDEVGAAGERVMPDRASAAAAAAAAAAEAEPDAPDDADGAAPLSAAPASAAPPASPSPSPPASPSPSPPASPSSARPAPPAEAPAAPPAEAPAALPAEAPAAPPAEAPATPPAAPAPEAPPPSPGSDR